MNTLREEPAVIPETPFVFTARCEHVDGRIDGGTFNVYENVLASDHGRHGVTVTTQERPLKLGARYRVTIERLES